MKKIWKWLGESNRWKHLLGGVAIGLAGDSIYCSAYVGVGVASALDTRTGRTAANGIGLTGDSPFAVRSSVAVLNF